MVREHGVADERVAEVAEQEEDREDERCRRSGAAEEAERGPPPSSAGRGGSRSGTTRRPRLQPRTFPPRSRSPRAVRRLGDVVDLDSVRDDPERYRREDRHWGDQLAAGDRHETIVTPAFGTRRLAGDRSGYRDRPWRKSRARPVVGAPRAAYARSNGTTLSHQAISLFDAFRAYRPVLLPVVCDRLLRRPHDDGHR